MMSLDMTIYGQFLGQVMSLVVMDSELPTPASIHNNHWQREAVMYTSGSITSIIHDIQIPLYG